MLLETRIEKPADVAWLIKLTGELDFSSAPSFRRSVDRGSHPVGEDVVLDLTDLRFLDSAGLAAIVSLHLQLDGEGARLAVVSAARNVVKMFSVTGISRFIDIAPTRAGAIAALQPL